MTKYKIEIQKYNYNETTKYYHYLPWETYEGFQNLRREVVRKAWKMLMLWRPKDSKDHYRIVRESVRETENTWHLK